MSFHFMVNIVDLNKDNKHRILNFPLRYSLNLQLHWFNIVNIRVFVCIREKQMNFHCLIFLSLLEQHSKFVFVVIAMNMCDEDIDEE